MITTPKITPRWAKTDNGIVYHCLEPTLTLGSTMSPNMLRGTGSYLLDDAWPVGETADYS